MICWQSYWHYTSNMTPLTTVSMSLSVASVTDMKTSGEGQCLLGALFFFLSRSLPFCLWTQSGKSHCFLITTVFFSLHLFCKTSAERQGSNPICVDTAYALLAAAQRGSIIYFTCLFLYAPHRVCSTIGEKQRSKEKRNHLSHFPKAMEEETLH